MSEKEAMNLKEVYGRIWKKERERRNDAIIISKKKEFFKEIHIARYDGTCL